MSALAVDADVGLEGEGMNYPRGGLATSAGGDGMFIDQSGECLKLFVDPRVGSARRIIKAAEAESADISTDHEEPETQLLVIHPSSMALFDSYCHPDWYSLKRRREYYQTINEGIEIEGGRVWRRKVMLKESWMHRCLKAGRFLGEEDDWAGCRVGGPPVEKLEPELEIAKELPVDLCVVELPKRSISASLGSVEDGQNVQDQDQDEDISMSDDGRLPLQSIAPAPPSPEKKPVVHELEDLTSGRSDTQGALGEIIALQAETSVLDEEGLGRRTQGIEISRGRTDGSESPEETLASMQPLKKKRRRRNSMEMLDKLDVATLDSGPSSQFASPQPEQEAEVEADSATSPTIQLRASQTPMTSVDDKVFRGLSVFVDLAVKNRSDLLKEIKSAGGQIVGDYSEATHVLVYKYWSNQSKWDTLVATHAPAGVWFVASKWAKASLRDGRRAPELKHCVPNAEQAVRSTPLTVQRIPVVDLSLAIAAIPLGLSKEAKKNQYEVSVERLDEIMQHQSAVGYNRRAREQMAERLAEKHGVYSTDKWAALYREWALRQGRFRELPPLEKRSTSTFQTLEETPLKLKAEPSHAEVPATATVTTTVTATEPGGGNGASSSVPRIGLGLGMEARMSTQAMAGALLAIHETHEGTHTVNYMAMLLHKTYPVYSEGGWRNFIQEWRGGRGRFRLYGPRWNGQEQVDQAHNDDQSPDDPVESSRDEPEPENQNENDDDNEALSERHEDEMEEARATSAGIDTADGIFRGPYTHEEDLALCQFARAMRERDGVVKSASWNEFAEVYPHRRPGTWAEHYRSHKNRIDQLDATNANPNATAPVSPATATEAVRPGRRSIQPTPNAEASSSTSRPRRSRSAISATPQTILAPKAEASPSSSAPKKKKKHPAESSSRVAEPTPSAVTSTASSPKPSKEPESLDKQHYDILAHYVVTNFPDDPPRRSAEFAALGESHPRFKARSWRKIWRRDQDHPMLKSSLEHYRKVLAARNAAASGSGGSGKKLSRNRYTDEDERKMAEFIKESVPSDRPARSSDWVIFQKTHKSRTAASWAEHYRQYKNRIDRMVDGLRASSFAVEMNSWAKAPKRDSRAGPSGVAATALTATEVVELGSDIEEEEEVEEIVPLQPTRRGRRAGNEPIVVISDDDD